MDDMQAAASDCEEAPGSSMPPVQIPNSILPIRRAVSPFFPVSTTSSLTSKQCEACRARKIRCDRESPCSHYQRADIDCVNEARAPREKRTRILLTPQYEKKIDRIDHRLEDITKLLGGLATHISAHNDNNKPRNEDSTPATVVSTINSSPHHSVPSTSVTGPVVEGESSLSAHSIFVNEFLQNFDGAECLKNPDLETHQTLDALFQIVNASKQNQSEYEASYFYARPRARVQQERCKLPPIQKAVSLIRIAKSQRLAGTGWIYEFQTMQAFGDLCLDVYFRENPSSFDIISVNAGLYSLCSDYACVGNIVQDEKDEYTVYSHLCRENLETELANLPLHLPATSNSIAALLFGAFYAMESSKSALCWMLSSKASELCQTLGYHRASTTSNNKPEEIKYQQFLFWTTYYLDKSLSLRLGRASTIPDCEITASLFSITKHNQEPVLAYFVLWIKAAKCQGRIYEMLYCPGSLNQSDSTRQSRVEFLVSSLHELQKETERTHNLWLKISKKNSGEDLMDFYAISDDILRLSLLTHVYRAAPRITSSTTTFSSDCIKVARATLERHHDCMAIIHKTNDIYFQAYIHLTLLFAPFVPFIVLFCHVMETRSHTDLNSLDAFIASIQSASAISEPAAKMHNLFQVLYNIALRYVQPSISVSHEIQEMATSTMEAHLAVLGFPYAGIYEVHHQQHCKQPSSHEGGNAMGFQDNHDTEMIANIFPDEQQLVNPVLLMGNGAQLEDWLYNNQESIELLQDPGTNSSFQV